MERPQATPSEQAWIHILKGDTNGGGHLFGVGVDGKTEAPESWDQEVFREAILAVQKGGNERKLYGVSRYEGLYRDVVFRVVLDEDELSSAYPLRGVGVGVNRNGVRVGKPLQSRDRKRYHDLYDPGS
jgi:hypothetical protein